MTNEPFLRRALARPPSMGVSRLDRLLGHPIAFLVTTAVLVLVFGWTFFTNPGRPAAADDPAYYHWRTEALLAIDPGDVIAIDGPLDMYASGYRVVTPVLAGLMRRVVDVDPLTPTIAIGVGLRVAIPLLLAGFAYRWRRDPVLWHATAFFVASLLPTPPFAGYLDNVMTLFFLSASLFFIAPSRTSWPARVVFTGLLLASGFTHPTTLAIFCMTLGLMAVMRFVARRGSLRTVLADDGPMLASAFVAAVATYATWRVGIWDVPASLGEAAVPPPADADFFRTRLGDWLAALRLPFNGPLLAIGLAGIVSAGRDFVEEELPRVSVAWLAPLAGVLGALVGLAYPYYRFFNTTTAWLLLVGVGAYLITRLCMDVARRGGVGMFALVGIVALGVIVAGNFKAGLAQTHWNDVSDAWIKPDELRDLTALRTALANEDRPVVFVVDNEVEEQVRVYGFLKLAGNVLRYAIPGHLQDRTGVYLGSLDNYRVGEPTDRDPYYRELSEASLENVRSVVGDADEVVVLPAVFNESGANTNVTVTDDVLQVRDGTVMPAGPSNAVPGPDAGLLHALRALVVSALLLLPGLWLVRWVFPEATTSDLLGLVPALATAALALVGIAVLGIMSSPLSETVAWVIVGATGGLALVAYLRRGVALSGMRPRSAD